jgi:hypothetical protein
LKYIYLNIVFLILFFLASCAKKPALQIGEITKETPSGTEKPAATAACGNIFYPLQQDNQWTYRLEFAGTPGSEKADLTMRITDVSENGAELAVISRTTGVEDESSVRCEDGAVIEFPLIEMDALFSGLGGGIDVTYEKGVFMPSRRDFDEADWKNKWSTRYLVNGQFEGRYKGETMKAVFSNSPAQLDWKVIGTGGEMRVAAGEFTDVVHIRRTAAIEVTSLQAVVSGTPVKLGTTLTLVTIMYYAPGVGLLRQDFESATVKLLFGINLPIQGSGSMELITYQLQD